MSPTTDIKLFHYTTPKGLIGIFSNNVLWASDIFSLNDAEELTRGMNIARNIIDRLYESADDSKKDRINRIRKDLAHIGPSQNISTLVCSFTEAGDQLSQWRAYCQGGGYAIGFPFDGLKKVAEAQDFVLAQCLYAPPKQESEIQKVIDETALPWFENPEPFKQKHPSSSVSDIGCGISNQLIWNLHGICSVLKNISFSEEKEWRLVTETKSDWHKKLMFRPKQGLVVPYIHIDLPDPDDRTFWNQVEVFVGPTPYPEESKKYVHRLFRKNHSHAISIKDTVSSFREL